MYFNSYQYQPHLIIQWILYVTQNLIQQYKINLNKLIIKGNKKDIKNQLEILQRIKQSFIIDFKGKQINYKSFSYNLPIFQITCSFYNKSQIQKFNQRTFSQSNLSQLLQSRQSQTLEKNNHKLYEEIKSNIIFFSGIIFWGNNFSLKPDIFPLTKNFKIKYIASGLNHVIFSTDSSIYGFSQNQSNQLGDSVILQTEKYKLYLLKQLSQNLFSFQISCGNQHTCILINQVPYIWGDKRNNISQNKNYKFDKVFCGGLHTIAIKDGKVYSWGRGQGGQLGHPFTQLKYQEKQQTVQYFLDSPKQIKGLHNIIKVACGDAHSIFLKEDGTVYVTGYSYQGQLGIGITGDDQTFQIFEPIKLDTLNQKIIDIFSGSTFSFFKTQNGKVYGCGLNDCSQIGIEKIIKVYKKKRKLESQQKNILTVTMNKFFSQFGLLNKNQNSQKKIRSNKLLSNKQKGDFQFSTPKPIQIFGPKTNIVPIKIASRQVHSLALVAHGNQNFVMGWGSNKSYQLIQNNQQEQIRPASIQSLFEFNVKQILCTSQTSWAIVQGEKSFDKVKKSQIKLNDKDQIEKIIKCILKVLKI